MIENATVEDLQHELQVMIQESIADLGLEDVSESDIAADLFGSMTYNYDYDVKLLAEVARREFGFVPMSARPSVADAFDELEF